MKRATLILAAFLAGAVAGPARAELPATWSLERASLSLSAQGAILQEGGEETSHLLPGVSLAYSLSDNLVLGGIVEYEFPSDLTIARGAARWKVFDNGFGAVSLGANLVGYSGEGASRMSEPTSWSASVNGQWAAIHAAGGRTLVWTIASAEFDEPNSLTTYRLGLRFQLVGGNPE